MDLKTSAKFILIAVLAVIAVQFVTTNILNKDDLNENKNNNTVDSFEDDKNKENFSNIVDKLTTTVDRLTDIVDNFKQKKEQEHSNNDDEETDDETDDEDDNITEYKKINENMKNKAVNKKKTSMNKKKASMNKKEKESFTNYAKGYSNSFGGDYLLLNN